KPLAKPEEEARPDADMPENEQMCSAQGVDAYPRRRRGERLKVYARVHHADGRSDVGLLRLRHTEQPLDLNRPRHHPGDGRPGGQIVVASGGNEGLSDGGRRLRLVRYLGLQAAVDPRAHRIVEAPARECLRLDVLAVLAAGLDAEHAVHDDFETSEAAAR